MSNRKTTHKGTNSGGNNYTSNSDGGCSYSNKGASGQTSSTYYHTGNGHDFYENKSEDYSYHENQNQGTMGYKEDETETPQPATNLSTLPILVLEKIFSYFDNITNIDDLYEADPHLEHVLRDSLKVKHIHEMLIEEENERRQEEELLHDDDYSDYQDGSEEEFTPYSGHYRTGQGDLVYCRAGEDRDLTACDQECGYCGRCRY